MAAADVLSVDIAPTINMSALNQMQSMLRGSLEKVFSATRSVAGVVSSAAGGNVLGTAAGVINLAGSALAGPTGGVSAALAGGVNTALTAVASIGQQVMQSVSTIAPGLTRHIESIFRDIQAVIGQTLIPVVSVFVPVMERLAGIVASMLPDMSTMNDLADAISEVMDAIMDALKELAPVIKVLVTAAIYVLIGALKVLTVQWKVLAELFRPFGRLARALTGGDGGQAPSPIGLATGGVSTVSTEDLGRSMIEAGFGSTSVLARLEETTRDIARNVQRITHASEREPGGAGAAFGRARVENI